MHKCGYINEIDLIKQLQKLTDELNLKKFPIQNKIKNEIKRFKKFQSITTGKIKNIDVNDVDVKNYAKFLLKEGSNEEKRELITYFKNKIILKNKVISLP